MKKILIHPSWIDKTYIGLIKYINHNESIDKTIVSLHNSAFDAVDTINPDTVVLPLAEYTQEFNDLIHTITNKNYLIWVNNKNDENAKKLCNMLSSLSNVRLIVNENNKDIMYDNSISCRNLYDDKVFYNTNSSRNDKIAVLLSSDHVADKEKLINIIYPHKQHKVVCFNNPRFDSVNNIGLLTDSSLNNVLNTYKAVIDMSVNSDFKLEAKACGCPWIDKNDIDDLKQTEITTDLLPNTLANFADAFVVNYLIGEKV